MKNLGLTQHTAALAALLLLPGLADHARGAPWTPADLSDKALWLDAADAGTITLNGSTVSQWDDKSGNSRNFAQATGANQPAYSATSFNTSYPGVTFDGSSDFMSAGDTLDVGTQSLGIIAAVKYNTSDTSGMVISKTRYAAGNGRYFMGRFQGTGFGLGSGTQYQYVGESDFASAISPGADSSTSPRLLGFDLNRQTSGFIKNWIDGVAVKTSTFTGNATDFNSSDLLLLGAYGNSSGTGPQASSYLSGVIAEVVVVQTAMSDADRWKLEGYLAWKWGMQDNLPADHPYKNAAPDSDTTQPTIATLSPADDATGVLTYANLAATFDEGIQKGAGNITLKKTADNSTVETFDVATSPRITVSGATLTINPTSVLDGLTGYYVQIDATAVMDLSNNSFAGIGDTDTTTWNFTTGVADTTAPAIATLSPAGDATGVAVDANLAATFDENIQKGTGNITLRKTADDSTIETFDVATSPRITVSGATLTIDPTGTLLPVTGYYVEIASTAIQDLSENAFAGISGATAWNFTTEPPVLFDDFAADPHIAGKWTRYSYNGTENATPTWNSTDQDLDLLQPASGQSILGLYRTNTTRSATDTVTLTVKDFARTGGTWGYVALMISAGSQPSLTSGANRYEFRIMNLASGYQYQLLANNGTDLIADTPTATFSGPVTLEIVRNGDNYDFKVNGSTLATGSSFTSAQHDAMVYYEIVFGGDGTTTATVDNFGISATDTTPPTLVGIVDDKSGGPVEMNSLVTYTVTFSEDMDAATVSDADFGNAGTATFSVGTVTETTPGVFAVPVTPTSTGTLQLWIEAGAVLRDLAGNALDTTSAIADDTIITVNTSAGYAAWQATNGTAGTIDQDHDADGVPNGIEYFLGGNTDTTGFTPLPGVSNSGGALSVTWTRHPDYPGFPDNYGTDFVVETSATLTGPWTEESSPGNVTITGNDVTYTFPSPLGAKKFARLKVTGP